MNISYCSYSLVATALLSTLFMSAMESASKNTKQYSQLISIQQELHILKKRIVDDCHPIYHTKLLNTCDIHNNSANVALDQLSKTQDLSKIDEFISSYMDIYGPSLKKIIELSKKENSAPVENITLDISQISFND